MPKISTYINATPISGSDQLIGTDASDMSMTKNFLISDLFAYFTSNNTLQGILNNGNTAANQSITLTGTSFIQAPLGVFENISAGNLTLSGYIIDGNNSSGNVGDLLMYTVSSGTRWQKMARGSFYSTVNQSAALIDTAYAMTLNTTDSTVTNGVSIASNSRITVATAGVYNLQFSAQLDRVSGSGTETVDIWFRKNGTDINNSNTKITMAGAASANKTVAAWNYMINMAANDYIQIMW